MAVHPEAGGITGLAARSSATTVLASRDSWCLSSESILHLIEDPESKMREGSDWWELHFHVITGIVGSIGFEALRFPRPRESYLSASEQPSEISTSLLPFAEPRKHPAL
jgi:hypothetical protein